MTTSSIYPSIRNVITHSTFDDFWKSYSMRYRYEDVETPALIVSGWYDNLVHEAFKLFDGWTTRSRSAETRRLTKLLIGGWSHGNIGSSEPFGTIGFGTAAGMDFLEEQLRWYDRRLKGIDNGMDDEPPVRIFVMGDNEFRYENEWPLARTQYTNYYLHSGGGANSLYGDGVLSTEAPGDQPPDRYSYDPNDPVPTLGGQIMAIQMTVSGPWDRRPVERRTTSSCTQQSP